MPKTASKILAISNEFGIKWNYPYALGALEGKHVMIDAPPNLEPCSDATKNTTGKASVYIIFVKVGKKITCFSL